MNEEHKRAAQALGQLMATHAGRTYLKLNHEDGCPFVVADLSDRMPEVLARVSQHIKGHAMVSVVFMRGGELDGVNFGADQPVLMEVDVTPTHHAETLRDFVGRLTMHEHGSTPASLGIDGMKATAFA